MSFRLLNPGTTVVVATLAMCGALVCPARAADKPRVRAIQFSGSKTDEITNNLNQISSKKDGLEKLQEDLLKPVRTLTHGVDSLDAVEAPPVRLPAQQPAQSKRARELRQQRKDRMENYIFLSPEEIVPSPNGDDPFQTPEYGPDGREKQKESALERYLKRLDARNSPKNGLGQPKDDRRSGSSDTSNSRDEKDASDNPNLPPGLRESEQSLRKLAQGDSPDKTAARRDSFADIFGLTEVMDEREKKLEHKKLMDDFHTILDPSWHPPARGDSFNPLSVSMDPGLSPAAPAAVTALPTTTRHDSSEGQLGAINPAFSPPGVGDVNSELFRQYNPPSSVPQAQTPKLLRPVTPNFVAPRRPF